MQPEKDRRLPIETSWVFVNSNTRFDPKSWVYRSKRQTKQATPPDDKRVGRVGQYQVVR